MTRSGWPIAQAPLKNPRDFVPDTGIRANARFYLWEAAVAAGATLTELFELDRGTRFDNWFRASLLKWYEAHRLRDMHSQDAAIRRPKRK